MMFMTEIDCVDSVDHMTKTLTFFVEANSDNEALIKASQLQRVRLLDSVIDVRTVRL